jgi:3-phytase
MDRETAEAGNSGAATEVVIAERWVSPTDTAWDIDTPAFWMGDGEGRVVATAKATHDLKVFDAATGALLPPIGVEGSGLGAFRRPNAVLVVGDLAFTVERDNHRVQVTRLPSGEPAGAFGDDVLVKPYGAVIHGALPDLTFWITDDYDVTEDARADGTADFTRRLHRFDVHLDADGTPAVRRHATHGEADGDGALAVVETIGLDAQANRLMVADEERKAYLVYDTLGRYTGDIMAEGRVAGDPEGMALVSCPGGGGYWIVTDQQPTVSWFRIFSRGDLAYVASFRGEVTANTDGVSFASADVPGFGGPAFFTVHDDQGVSAFAWADVERALGLEEGCGRS